ncbi:hypothetical protein EV06_0643 [Prochlorococcus sp. MIT 0602]|nr:hypothetical protein EV06_0643 [Prochlorococcus sp. MIT 0602]KGG18226.1 hypothetical protein EV07_0141 [Prochlorococcus sp. MIT 0603]
MGSRGIRLTTLSIPFNSYCIKEPNGKKMLTYFVQEGLFSQGKTSKI